MWKDISYDLIPGLLLPNSFDSMLVVSYQITNMDHYITCKETMGANHLDEQMLRYVWKFHRTPKTIVYDQGSVFILQVTKEINKNLPI